MGRDDRLSDNVRYVINGVVRKPLIWILLSIFCIGDYLFNTGTEVLISMHLINQYVRVNVDIPVYLLQYRVVIPALMILAGFLLIVFKGGYVTMVYRGVFPAPPVNNWKRLLFDGLVIRKARKI